jgi:hypothetical protein
MKRNRFAPCAVVVALAWPVAGCAASYIPNTDVPDNAENREIIAFCELYRKAAERRDSHALLKLTSPDYYEDGGNADASDDMDYVEFKKWITGENKAETGISYQDAMAIRHEIRYRRVIHEKKRIFVDYTFSASFKIPTSRGDQWKRKVDDNRLELVQDDKGKFKVVAGF